MTREELDALPLNETEIDTLRRCLASAQPNDVVANFARRLLSAWLVCREANGSLFDQVNNVNIAKYDAICERDEAYDMIRAYKEDVLALRKQIFRMRRERGAP